MKQFKVKADSLRVRQIPSIDGEIIGSLQQGDIVSFRKFSEDEKWIEIEKDELIGWSSYNYLIPIDTTINNEIYSDIFEIVSTSSIVNYHWKDRGRPAVGYYKGMALVFSRLYCKLKNGDQVAIEMAKADTGNPSKDVLSFYAEKLNDVGMYNEADGADTLRHLLVLMIGLGMRESSGRYCVGRDMSAQNTTADTAEAGLFQTSYNARSSNPVLLNQIFQHYKNTKDGFVDIFKEGVTCSESNWENYGDGEGKEFQQLSKECPAFGAEFAGVALRSMRKHWGPINRKEVEIKKECDVMLREIQHYLDINNIHSI